MPFRKEVIIYESENVKVYINQCHNPGKKTLSFAVRKDVEKKFLAQYLGEIKWNGAWRQYCFYPDNDTFWNSSCMQEIVNFCTEITQVERSKWRKNPDKIHYRVCDSYLCNVACYIIESKCTKNPKKVTCKNCLIAIEKGRHKKKK